MQVLSSRNERSLRFIGIGKAVAIAGLVLGLVSCGSAVDDVGQSVPSSAKAITAFTLESVTGSINETNKTIAVTLPFGTPVTALVATFTTTGASISVGMTPQTSGTSANDFTNPVIYTVTAADASTVNYTVTVDVAPSFAKAITTFSLEGVTGSINETNKTIAVTLPFGASVTARVATFTTTGASVTVGTTPQISGTTMNNFTSPVTYTVAAADATTVNYTVTVAVASSFAKAITAFSLVGVTGSINETNQTIAVTLPFGTNVSALVATFTTTGASVTVGTTPQISGTTANDFTSPVTYTVTAADATTVNYTVTVIFASFIGGTVSGLASGASIVLQNNGAVNLTVAGNGAFTFATPINNGSAYNVTILAFPLNQPCTLTYGAGTAVTGSNVSSIQVICGPAFVGTFTATGSMTTTRFAHTATLLPNGKVLVAGGNSGVAAVLASAELYDPTTGNWTATGSMTSARTKHTATLLPNGKVLVAGGYSGAAAVASAELYDPTTNTWTATGSMAVVRYYHIATLLPNGKVLVAGGYSGAVVASAELYDPATNTWTATGSMTSVRYWHTATLLPNGKVLVVGGHSGAAYLASTELFDPTTGSWTATGSMTVARYSHTMTLLPNGKILVAGGGGGVTQASAELYNPVTGNWTATGGMTDVRIYHAATLLPNGKVLVAGGYNGGANLASTELYDPATNTWTATGSMTVVRYYHTATLLPNGKLLVAGSQSGGAALASAELFW